MPQGNDIGSDALVIGAGIAGLCTALALRERGLSVRLIDRGPVGREASWAGGGILSPLCPWREDPALATLTPWCQRFYRTMAPALRQATGIDPEWVESGLLCLDAEEQDAALAWAAASGARMEPLTREEARDLSPAAGVTAPALWLPTVAQIRNPRLLAALTVLLRQRGVEIEEGNPCQGLWLEGGQVRGAHTDQGPRAAAATILATGVWSSGLAGLPATAIEPVRGQMLLYHLDPPLLGPILLKGGRYAIPRQDGHCLVGSTVERAGFTIETTAAATLDLRAAATALLPFLAEQPPLRQWAGLRPNTPSGLPLVGPVPGHPGLYLHTGHFRTGLLHAPGTAEILAALLVGDTPPFDPQPYLPS
jgi:glycine oxidase